MSYLEIKDQERVITILQNAINGNRVSQSYLFYGPEGCGKFTMAHLFAMAINCEAEHHARPCGVCKSCVSIKNFTHPDFMYIFPSSKLDFSKDGEIKNAVGYKEHKKYIKNKIDKEVKPFVFSSNAQIRIESIRLLQHKIFLTSTQAQYKIFLIENIDKMKENAANAFLKTLEEPPNNSIIIMTSSRHEILLPTILSRSQKIAFSPVSKSTIESELINKFSLDSTRAKFISRFSKGNMKKALLLGSEGEIEMRKEMILFLRYLTENKQLDIITFIMKYKSAATRIQLEELISYLIIWLGDIGTFHYLPNNIVNIDQAELMEKFTHIDNLEESVPELIKKISYLKVKLKMFVNPQLILTEIYNLLKDAFFA